MASQLRVDNILPSVGTNVAIGTAGGSITLTGTTSGTFSGDLTGNVNSTGVTTVTTLSATNIVGVSTLGVTTAYINTIDASSAVSINQNLVFASGKGIDFSATGEGSGTMSSELLDDYEEGTWTPIPNWNNSLGSPTPATYTSVGSYTKIGQIVNFYCRVVVSNLGSATGNFTITGLPFTNKAGNNGTPCYLLLGAAAVTSQVQVYVEQNTTAIFFEQINTGTQSVLNQTHIKTGSSIFVRGQYTV